MTAVELVDYSFARPGGKTLAAAGKRGVLRYLTGQGKALSVLEARDLHAFHLDIGLIFESAKGRALDGEVAGRTDANSAKAAMALLGVPSTVAVYFAVDFDAQPPEQPRIDAYLRGCAGVLGLGRVGVYGGFNLITRCNRSVSATYFWQTYAWSGGRLASFAHLYQYSNGQNIGGAVDLDRALQPDWGQWSPDGVQSGPQQEVIPVSTFTPKPGLLRVTKGVPIYDAPDLTRTPISRVTANADIVCHGSVPGWRIANVNPTTAAWLPGDGGGKNPPLVDLPLPVVAADCSVQDAEIVTLTAKVGAEHERFLEAAIVALKAIP